MFRTVPAVLRFEATPDYFGFQVCASAGVPGPNAASDKVVHSKEMDPFEVTHSFVFALHDELQTTLFQPIGSF
jgi:hypothetical protein